MSRPTRRLTLSAILLGLALAFAAPPVQARESLSAGWLDALAHQLTQWTAGWRSLPAGAAAGSTSGRHTPPARPQPPVRPDCGGLVNPDGSCASAAPHHY